MANLKSARRGDSKKKEKVKSISLSEIASNPKLVAENFSKRSWYLQYLQMDGLDLIEIGVPLNNAARITSKSDLTPLFKDPEDGTIIEFPTILEGDSMASLFGSATEENLILIEKQSGSVITIKRGNF